MPRRAALGTVLEMSVESMVTSDELDTHATQLDDRPLPFVLRRCLSWLSLDELPSDGDGQLRFWQRAGLTGNVVLTSQGRDVHFSDLEVS